MAKLKGNYFKVITDESKEDSADILLYGYIGQDFWWDEDLNEESITDLAFAKTMSRLEAKYDRINVRINSPGGSMYHGNAIVTAIRNSKAEVHTYNDGLAASMAADIWLAGHARHMAKNALCMIHAPSSWAWGTAKDLRQEADVLDKFEHTAIVVMVEATGLSEKEVKDTYYDYEDHWFTAKECEELGFISKVEEYDAEDTIEGVEKMSLRQIMKHFAQQEQEQPTKKSPLSQITSYITKEIQNGFSLLQKSNSPIFKSIYDMKKEDFKKSLDNKELSVEDVTAILKGQGFDVTKTVEEVPPTVEETDEGAIAKAVADALDPLKEELKTLKETNKTLTETVTKLEKKPAEEVTELPSDEDPAVVDEDDATKEYKKLNEQFYQAGADGKMVTWE